MSRAQSTPIRTTKPRAAGHGRKAGWSLLTLILLAASVNAPASIWMKSVLDRHARRAAKPVTRWSQLAAWLHPPRSDLFQQEAAGGWPWPSRTPHSQPWPAPKQVQLEIESFGVRTLSLWSSKTDEHGVVLPLTSMVATSYGWPFGVWREVRLWWPWSDPEWALPTEPTSRTELLWRGLLLNPLLVGGGLWAVLIAAPLLATGSLRAIVRRRRRTRGACLACGYDLRGGSADTVCPECGQSR